MDRRDFLQSATLAAGGVLSGEAMAAGGPVLAQAATSVQGSAPHAPHGGPMTKRWTEQRWLLDTVIQANGIDWDQPRSIYWNVPCGVEASADFAAIRARVKKYADCSPAFEATARRREAKARAAQEAREFVTARDNYFLAAIPWGAAQWPIDENHEQNLLYNKKKRECYTKYARLAEWVMGRPQIQEEAVVQLADLIQEKTQPDGLALVVEAEHFCMQWRGVKEMDSKMINSVMRGVFLKDPNLRREFLSLLPRKR